MPEAWNREADKSWLAEAGKPGWQGSLGGWEKQEAQAGGNTEGEKRKREQTLKQEYQTKMQTEMMS